MVDDKKKPAMSLNQLHNRYLISASQARPKQKPVDDNTLSTAKLADSFDDVPRFDFDSPSPPTQVLNRAGEVNFREPVPKFNSSSPRLFSGIADFDSPSPTLEGDPGDSWYDDDSSCEDSVEKLSKASNMNREREGRRMHNEFHTLGYRDGLIAGKEAALQEGFNIGFKDSVLTGYNWGLVRGFSSAMAFLPGALKEKLVEKEETRNKFQRLQESVQSISSTDALKLFYEDQKRSSLKQETAKPSSTEIDHNNQSPVASVLNSYHVQLQSILDQSPLVDAHLKIN